MAKATVYNTTGKQNGTAELVDDIFATTIKSALVHEVYVALRANARQPWAHTKDRSEVRGGGKKPWRQKGTGRARHGSTRSPIWSGGGVTFGPRNIQNFKKKINRKTNQLAVKMCLSDKVAHDQFIVLDALKSENGKTKDIFTVLKQLPSFGRKALVIVAQSDEKLMRALQNIPDVDIVRATDVNVVDLLHHQYVIIDNAGIESLTKRLS